jgi:putative ABC transport system permease protein
MWALGLVAVAIGVSLWQQLDLAKSLTIATGRMLIQLTAVGYFLAVVFAWKNPVVVLLVIGVMSAIAAIVARNRISQTIPRLFILVWGSILGSALLTLGYVNLLILQPPLWYDPQYVITLAGILLGNTMTSSAIAGERLISLVKSSHVEIETHLSLGATPQQAIQTYRRDAVKAGLIPTLNSMMVVGIVTLPGTITGQLLSNVDPLDAASYQMLIMLMLTFATLMATLLVTTGLCRTCFNDQAQLILPR